MFEPSNGAELMSIVVAGEAQFGKMARHMSRLMDQMQKGFFAFSPNETWTPEVNLYENDAAYLVCVDLAGVDKEKIDLSVAEGHLRLRGHRLMPAPPGMEEGQGGTWHIHVVEIDHGAFTREVELPADVDRDKIAATYRSGMLWVELPKVR
jgi:HSP20 family protein